jgi:AcrR family transcriptional regulator
MDSPARRDMVTDMAIGLILENGLAAVTVRGVAKKIGIAAPTLLGWYGSAERVRLVVGQTYCGRWVQWIQRREFRDGLLALLPVTAEEVGWTRVWEAVLELARLDDDVAACVADTVAFERHLADGVVADEVVDEVLALVAGLREAVTRSLDPMDPVVARHILAQRLARAEGPVPDPN